MKIKLKFKEEMDYSFLFICGGFLILSIYGIFWIPTDYWWGTLAKGIFVLILIIIILFYFFYSGGFKNLKNSNYEEIYDVESYEVMEK